MKLYVCLDDRNGMLFNRRRQSRDKAVLEDIRSQVPGDLTIDPFSEKMIRDAGIPCALLPEDAEPEQDAHFFLENRDPAALVAQADRVVLYRWNRHYPADVHWQIDLTGEGFSPSERTEFPGNSHETITKEVYVK